MSKLKDLTDKALKLEKEGLAIAAWSIYQEIIKIEPNHLPTLYKMATMLYGQKEYEKSIEIFRHLIQFQPHNVDLWFRCGLSYSKIESPEAISCFRKVLFLHPKTDQKARNIAYLHLAKALKHDEQYEEAKKIATSLIKKETKNSSAYSLLGQIAQHDGENEKAYDHLLQVIQLRPDNAQACFNFGLICFALEKIDEAEEYLQKAISLRPKWINPYRELAQCFLYNGDADKALELLIQALSLDTKDIESLRQLSQFYIKQGDHKKSIDYGMKIIKIAPNDWDTHLNLGLSYATLGYSQGSLTHFQKAYELKAQVQTAFSLACAYKTLKNFKQSDYWYSIALELDPEYFSAIYDTIFRKMECCDWETRKEDEDLLTLTLNKHLMSTSYGLSIPQLFFNYYDLPMHLHRKVHEYFDKGLKKKMELLSRQVDFEHSPKDRKILNIGYISPDFRDHPVGRLVADLFMHHNRSLVKVFGYTLTPFDPDDVYAVTIKNGCDVYHDLSYFSSVQAAKRIYEDNIDILVDLAGHTAYKRSEIIALQAAPIQAHMIGYPDTMGMKSVQYILADKHLAPLHLAEYYTEEIYHLPSSFIGRRHRINETALTKADVGLPQDVFIFAGFHRPAKIEPELFQSWMNILKVVDKSVIWLSEMTEEAKRNLLDFCEKSGVDPSRIIFSTKLDYDIYIESHKLVDLFLDTWHYSAGSTIIAALGAGLPVLTVVAENNASRMGGSIVAAAGLSDLICYDLASYERKAVELASNPKNLQKYRTLLSSSQENILLFDYAQFASNIEFAFKDIYRKWKISSRGSL